MPDGYNYHHWNSSPFFDTVPPDASTGPCAFGTSSSSMPLGYCSYDIHRAVFSTSCNACAKPNYRNGDIDIWLCRVSLAGCTPHIGPFSNGDRAIV